MPAPSCHAQPPGDRRPEHALALADIVAPRIVNNLVLATARHRPSTRLASATAKLIRGLELRALFAPGKSAKMPA